MHDVYRYVYVLDSHVAAAERSPEREPTSFAQREVFPEPVQIKADINIKVEQVVGRDGGIVGQTGKRVKRVGLLLRLLLLLLLLGLLQIRVLVLVEML